MSDSTLASLEERLREEVAAVKVNAVAAKDFPYTNVKELIAAMLRYGQIAGKLARIQENIRAHVPIDQGEWDATADDERTARLKFSITHYVLALKPQNDGMVAIERVERVEEVSLVPTGLSIAPDGGYTLTGTSTEHDSEGYKRWSRTTTYEVTVTAAGEISIALA